MMKMEAELKRMKKEFEDYENSIADLVEAKFRENDYLNAEIQCLAAETHVIQFKHEVRRKYRDKRWWEIQMEFKKELNELMKKKMEKIEELFAELEKDLDGEDEDEEKGVWQMLFHPIQYFWGSEKKGSQKQAMKRTMEVHADKEEPETKRKRTNKKKTPGLKSLDPHVAELN